MTEPDPATLADAIRRQDRADRDDDVAEDLNVAAKLAEELAGGKA